MVEFGELQPDGTVTHVRTITREQILACPHTIIVAEHYRRNGVCRCNDPYHSMMKTWGYRWNVDKKEWV